MRTTNSPVAAKQCGFGVGGWFSTGKRSRAPKIRERVLTDSLLDLNDKVILRVVAAEGEDLFFSRLDGQRGFVSFSIDDVTELGWQSWAPRLYENRNATSVRRGNLKSFWKKEEKWSEQDDSFRSPHLLPSPPLVQEGCPL